MLQNTDERYIEEKPETFISVTEPIMIEPLAPIAESFVLEPAENAIQ